MVQLDVISILIFKLKGNFMKKERILSFQMSQKLSGADIEAVAAAGQTSYLTAGGTYGRGTGGDASLDWTLDL
jgi:hypothetical protein